MKRRRFFEVGVDGIRIGCLSCNDVKDSSEFYVKYKNLPQTSVSHWQEKCRACAKRYRSLHYALHSQEINSNRMVTYYQNHEAELEKARKRSLNSSANPDRLRRRRAVQSLTPDERYVHDRCVQWKAQATRRHLSWNLDETWILEQLGRQDGLCFYTKRPLVLCPNSRDTLSVDRVDSSLGYNPDNVVLCGALVNKMKLDMSLREFVQMVDTLYRNVPMSQPGDEN